MYVFWDSNIFSDLCSDNCYVLCLGKCAHDGIINN